MRKTATLLEQSLRRAKDTTTLHYEGEIKRGSSRRTVAGREAGGTCHQVIRIIRRGDFPAPEALKSTATPQPPHHRPAAIPPLPLSASLSSGGAARFAQRPARAPACPPRLSPHCACAGRPHEETAPPLRRRAPPRPAPCRTGSASPPASSSPAPLPRVRRCRWAPAGPRFSLQRTGLARPRGLLRPAGPRRPPPPAIPSLPRVATAALCGRSPARGVPLPAPLWCAPRFALFFFGTRVPVTRVCRRGSRPCVTSRRGWGVRAGGGSRTQPLLLFPHLRGAQVRRFSTAAPRRRAPACFGARRLLSCPWVYIPGGSQIPFPFCPPCNLPNPDKQNTCVMYFSIRSSPVMKAVRFLRLKMTLWNYWEILRWAKSQARVLF